MRDLERAKLLLDTSGYTCVLCKDEMVYTSTLRGVAPMVAYLSHKTMLDGFSAADKVVGKAAAMLFVLAGVKAVYAGVLSNAAANFLRKHGIRVAYGTMTDSIINRAGTGPCPMEQAVTTIESPQEAFCAIKAKLKTLNTK